MGSSSSSHDSHSSSHSSKACSTLDYVTSGVASAITGGLADATTGFLTGSGGFKNRVKNGLKEGGHGVITGFNIGWIDKAVECHTKK